MKRLLQRIRDRKPAAAGFVADRVPEESDFFSPSLPPEADEPPDAPQPVATWPQRAASIGAKAADRSAGIARFIALWTADNRLQSLRAIDIERLAEHLEYIVVPADCEVIGQDELGDYLLVVLDGRVAVERVQSMGDDRGKGSGSGSRMRLAEAKAGDILGEMSLLDGGARFSSCRTLAPTTLAVIDAARLDAMLEHDPRLGVALLASLSRRLSLRLRKVSARLSALLSQN